jgi:hypothetical protein
MSACPAAAIGLGSERNFGAMPAAQAMCPIM